MLQANYHLGYVSMDILLFPNNTMSRRGDLPSLLETKVIPDTANTRMLRSALDGAEKYNVIVCCGFVFQIEIIF
jgi:hypothetical protein